MKSYLQLLQDKAGELDVSLLAAFRKAEIPTSTYYRTINGATELRHTTAARVMDAIEDLHSLKEAREYTEGLRSSGQPVNRRSIRAKFKSRRAST